MLNILAGFFGLWLRCASVAYRNGYAPSLRLARAQYMTLGSVWIDWRRQPERRAERERASQNSCTNSDQLILSRLLTRFPRSLKFRPDRHILLLAKDYFDVWAWASTNQSHLSIPWEICVNKSAVSASPGRRQH